MVTKALAILLAVALALLVPTSGNEEGMVVDASGVSALVAMERSAPVFNVLYRYGQTIPAPNGAYGPNTSAPASAWFLEYQRAGAIDVFDGVLRPDGDPSMISLGLRMFRFGLLREAPNGSFPGSAWPFHGTAMFLSEAVPSLLTLAHSPYAPQFAAELRWDTQLMQRAAYHMVRYVGGPSHIDDPTKNHRLYEAALALGATGLLAHDATLQVWAQKYAWRAIHMERSDGVMPEDGGHDTGYQALGMVNASRYLSLLPAGNLHDALYTALRRGENWEISRVGADGTIDQKGDTRTAGCKEHDPAGRCKTVFYDPIFSALAHWATLSGDARFAQAAQRVYLRSGYGGH